MLTNPNLELPLSTSRDLSRLSENITIRVPVVGENEDFVVNCFDKEIVAMLQKRNLVIATDNVSINSHSVIIARDDDVPIQSRLYQRNRINQKPMLEEPVSKIVLSRMSDGSGLYVADTDRENVRDITTFGLFLDLTARYALAKQISSRA
ncbi:hypothetical protein EON76_03720 [bacterium]|nr:MAG: hypothetical protein EON76_03720 [bacterium]